MCQDQIKLWDDGVWTRYGGPSEDHWGHSTQAQGIGCLALRVIGIDQRRESRGPHIVWRKNLD